jgi:hypothetical protein
MLEIIVLRSLFGRLNTQSLQKMLEIIVLRSLFGRLNAQSLQMLERDPFDSIHFCALVIM